MNTVMKLNIYSIVQCTSICTVLQKLFTLQCLPFSANEYIFFRTVGEFMGLAVACRAGKFTLHILEYCTYE